MSQIKVCHGGPLDQQEMAYRPDRGRRGFLLVDKPAGICWIYDHHPGSDTFLARTSDPMLLHEDRPDNRHRAAEEFEFDVVAAPWVGVDDGDR